MEHIGHLSRHLHSMRGDPGRTFWYHGYLLSFAATGEDTAGQFAIVETYGRRDHSLLPPKHVHHNEEESFYLIAGEATFHVDGEPIQAGPGSLVVLPRDVPHWFTIDSDEVHWLNIITPAGFESFFLELGEPAQSLTLPPAPDGPLNIPGLLAAAARHNCEILHPD